MHSMNLVTTIFGWCLSQAWMKEVGYDKIH